MLINAQPFKQFSTLQTNVHGLYSVYFHVFFTFSSVFYAGLEIDFHQSYMYIKCYSELMHLGSLIVPLMTGINFSLRALFMNHVVLSSKNVVKSVSCYALKNNEMIKITRKSNA